MDPPHKYAEIIIFAPTPVFLKQGDLALGVKKEYKALRSKNNFWKRNTLIIEVGDKKNPSELSRQLSDLGYERHSPIYRSEIHPVRGRPANPVRNSASNGAESTATTAPGRSTSNGVHKGEFFQQGGLTTIFPINHTAPLTVEFLGNEIISIEAAKLVPHKEIFSISQTANSYKLKSGDYVVHEDHGIGIFREIKNEYLIIEYAPARKGGEADKLSVPKKFSKKVSPYLGLKRPQIHRLGTPLWFKTRKKAKEDIMKFAKELLALYKTRSGAKRPPYEQSEIEKNIWDEFGYKLTPGQDKALEEIFKDLGKNEPMERLVVGDVGFGKTEVALRAATRVILNGKQVALLSPTTILADQHASTFKERLEPHGVIVKRLTRLESASETKEILEKLEAGKVDILIGTHRILSQDIKFSARGGSALGGKNLGLVIIDEEQRFGVKQKETLKEKHPDSDIIYLSATPIPRTLSFSLSRIRPLSLIADPPEGRKSIETFVMPRNDKLIKEVIEAELKRKGQIYFLSSRIHKIPAILEKLEKLSPKTKKAILHGRLSEKEIIKTMREFREGKIQILVSTTIIENGLDISRVNTLIAEDAPRLGLAQAHQLRGRIGRGEEQAYAYFLYGSKKLPLRAEERLEALLEFKELGAGFEIAKRDLELRGAGNVLGKEQSGVMNRIGWNLYFQILSQSIEELEG